MLFKTLILGIPLKSFATPIFDVHQVQFAYHRPNRDILMAETDHTIVSKWTFLEPISIMSIIP